MKPAFFFSNVFLGTFFILLGISIFVKIFFNIDIPVFKTIVAVMLIWLGFSMLTGYRMWSYKADYTYASSYTNASSQTHNIGMGTKVIDLTTVTTFPSEVFINCAFSTVKVKIPRNIPILISLNACSSSAELPNGDLISFASTTYKTDPHATSYDMHIHANVFCSSFKFVYE